MSDRTFTQDEVNKIVQDRLAQERNKQNKALELAESNVSAEDYKAKFEKLEKQMADDEQARKDEQADKTLTDAITAVFPADKKFTSDYVRNGIIADMKAEIAKEENQGKGYAEIFTGLTTDKEGIFQSLHPAGQMTGINANVTAFDALRKAMKL